MMGLKQPVQKTTLFQGGGQRNETANRPYEGEGEHQEADKGEMLTKGKEP